MSTATFSSPFLNGRPPTWASGYGQDRYGYFADFSIATGPHYWQFISQRMRWIPAGTFIMGSPTDEAERGEDEIQHEVSLTQGFWLADTCCSQSIWHAITGTNPSGFQDDEVYSRDLPVERVTFAEVQEFITKLNVRLNCDAAFSLPSEAQWEYACRAGTSTPFSFGDTITTEQANFDGNYPYASSPKGEYRKMTVPVKSFSRNPWGLYQMHGNVWEWCADWYEQYSLDDVTDPTGPESGSYRVMRGGSWISYARSVRSACRFRVVRGLRDNYLGFRLLNSAS